jgi:catechol 2,3-dioxygenase-like lactoylglutathione lyase family enzyme
MNSQRELQVRRSGGPVSVIGYDPIFRVMDIQRATQHYTALGFRINSHDETYAFASLGNLTVHLVLEDGEGWPGYQPHGPMTSVLYLHVDDADRLAADWRTAGLAVHGPTNQDYGKREGQHLDPDGNLIRFGSPIPR